MSRRFLALFAPLLLVAGPALGDDEPKKVDSALNFLTNPEVIYVNIESDALVSWVKPILDQVDRQFARETKPRTVVVQLTIYPDKKADVEMAGQPALSAAEVKALLAAADPAKSPRSRVVECSLRVEAKVNGGAPEKAGPLTPALLTPAERRFRVYDAAPLAKKIDLMRRWARAEAVPLLAECALRRNKPEDKAVRALGKTLKGVNPGKPIDVAALTDKNPDYWRGVMATATGDPLVPAMKAALYVANGEIRRAAIVVDAVGPYDSRETAASYLLGDFRRMLAPIDKEVNDRISKGIALNDQGKLDEATGVYNDVLKDYPKSAWALYERFHTTQAKGLKAKVDVNTLMKDWPETRKAILDADPLYPTLAGASGRDEFYDLLLRQEGKELFKDQSHFARDIVRYADIALELGQPGLAALVYWDAQTAFKPQDLGNRNLVEDVLYCLEQLGVKGVKADFKGDHAAEFKRIDAERAKRKREYPGVKSAAEPEKPAK